MKKTMMALGAAALAAGLLGGCAYAPPMGGLYTHASIPRDFDNPGKALKHGEACSQGILGLIAWGDASIGAAARDGGITTVHTTDISSTTILYGWLYNHYCVEVMGE